MKITKKARRKVGRSNAHTTQIHSTNAHKPRLELETWHREFTTRTELKSLTQSIKCADAECGSLRMLSECLNLSSMRLGVSFIAPRQLGAVGDNLGRQFLPSVEWHIEQSGAPPDSYCRLSGARFPSKSDTVDRCSSGLVDALDIVLCPCRPLELPRVARRFRGRPLALATIGSPDSPVHHWTVR